MSQESSIKCPNCGELILYKNIDLIIIGFKYAKN